MSVAQPSVQDRRPSANLTLQNLPSNNPFRRAASPVAPSPRQDNSDPPSRPTSTNPFLENYQQSSNVPLSGRRSISPDKGVRMGPFPAPPLEPTGASNGVTTDKMASLTLTEKSPSDMNVVPKPAPERETYTQNGATLANGHRVARSNEEAKISRPDPRSQPRRDRPPVAGSPARPMVRRPIPRRNSETSAIDVKDDERKAEEGRPQESEGNPRIRDLKGREGRSQKPRRPNHRIDPIDKLDLTGIYGSAMFHHDGPFDACNPSRNRKGMRSAPMQAFAEGSANNSLGGSGPVNKVMDYDKYRGITAEGYSDFNATASQVQQPEYLSLNRRAPMGLVDPKGRYEHVYGEESAGLGADTFLEGTPVSKAVLERQNYEADNGIDPNQPTLQRKKSLVQRIRGRGPPRPRNAQGDPNRMASPEGYGDESWPLSPTSPVYQPTVTQSAGGHRKMYESNPFFNEEGENIKKAAAGTRVYEAEKSGPMTPAADEEESRMRTRAMSSPRRGLARRLTNENQGEASGGGDVESKPPATGLLGRVKSLKGRKTRPDRSGSGSQPQP